MRHLGFPSEKIPQVGRGLVRNDGRTRDAEYGCHQRLIIGHRSDSRSVHTSIDRDPCTAPQATGNHPFLDTRGCQLSTRDNPVLRGEEVVNSLASTRIHGMEISRMSSRRKPLDFSAMQWRVGDNGIAEKMDHDFLSNAAARGEQQYCRET